MDTATEPSATAFWTAHAHFSAAVNCNIIRSEIEGGVHLREVAPHTRLFIETQNRVYTMEVLDNRRALLSGHPEYCMEPTEVRINGSTWGGSMIRSGFVGRDMFLEFDHPVHRTIRTTRILDIYAASRSSA